MSMQKRNEQGDKPVEVGEDGTGDKARYEGKKRIQKRKFILEGVLGFSVGLFSRFLPAEILALLFLSCLLCIVFLLLLFLLE